ncbi:MAG: hypothetical protein JWM32_1789 [Verrucomicrobia bacterium]|nr:hypothetical protein [Verrucomicrobiota bacterium]
MVKAKIVVGLALIFGALQFVRPAKNISSSPLFTGKADITVVYPASPDVRKILAESCYDCHSNHTRYPWYAEVQPAAWWLASHVSGGKKNLNFSEFGSYSPKRQMNKLEAICDEVRDDTMPLKSYLWVHRSARLSPAQANALCRWAEGAEDQIAAK